MDTRDKASDRRAAKRQSALASVRFECRKGALGLGANILLKVENVSQTGMRLRLKCTLAVKDEVELVFENSGIPPTKRLGNITWVTPMPDGTVLVGVHFDKALSFREVQAISRPL
jgi:hypothetical protein